MEVINIKREREWNFPVLLENARYGTIILVTGWQTKKKVTYKGVCIHSRDNKQEVGTEIYWSPEAFTLFKGTLILEQ